MHADDDVAGETDFLGRATAELLPQNGGGFEEGEGVIEDQLRLLLRRRQYQDESLLPRRQLAGVVDEQGDVDRDRRGYARSCRSSGRRSPIVP